MNPILSMTRRVRSTPFTSRVNAAGVKGYTVYNHMLLPTFFRSVEEDYWHLCQHVQVWDVSCERQVQIRGADATELVQFMTPRDVSQAQNDQCFYLPLCDEQGKIINDPIAIKIDEQTWWLSIADSDVILWAKGLAAGRGFQVEITEPNVHPVAVQGPKAEQLMQRVFGDEVKDIRFFRYKCLSYQGHPMIVARSGWSKQGGFEVYVDNDTLGLQLWDELFEKGEDLNVGHGCPNNIERMESGLLSFGNDMDYSNTPLQCGLDKYCHLDRDLASLSVAALAKQKAEGVPARLMGLVIPEMPEAPSEIELKHNANDAGYMTSQCISAKYDAWLAFAMLDQAVISDLHNNPEQRLQVIADGVRYDAHCVELPFDFAPLGLTLRPRPVPESTTVSVLSQPTPLENELNNE